MKGLVLTYVITALATVGALRSPLIGLYVYVGFAVLRPQALFGWAGDMNYLSLSVGTAMLIGWAGQGFGSWNFGRARPVVVALLLFFGWLVLSAFFALNTERAFKQVSYLARVVLPVLVGATMIREEKHWRRLLWTIVLCQGYVGLEMHIEYLIKGRNSAHLGFAKMDNNFFALSLVTTLGPAVALAIASRRWWERGLAALSSALILHTTLLTFSRGGMVGLLAVGAVAIVMMPKRPKYIGAILLTAMLAVWLTGPELAARYGTTLSGRDDRDASAQSRIDLWRDCLRVIRQYPVLGVGPANWRVIANRYGWPPGKSAHSVWMEMAAEIGIPGALFMLMFFCLAAMKLWPIARARAPDADPYAQALAGGTVLSVVGFAVTGQFVSAPFLEGPYYVVMAGVGLLAAMAATKAAARAPVTSPASRFLVSPRPVRGMPR